MSAPHDDRRDDDRLDRSPDRVVDFQRPVDLDLDDFDDNEIRPFVVTLFGEQWEFPQPTLGTTIELDRGSDSEEQIELVFGEHWPKVASRVKAWRGTRKMNLFMYRYRLHFQLGDERDLKQRIADLENPADEVKPNRSDRRASRV